LSALAFQRADHVERKQDDGAIPSAVEARVALPIAVQALLGDQCFEEGGFRDPSRRGVDGLDSPCRRCHSLILPDERCFGSRATIST